MSTILLYIIIDLCFYGEGHHINLVFKCNCDKIHVCLNTGIFFCLFFSFCCFVIINQDSAKRHRHKHFLLHFPDFHMDLQEWGPIYTLWANSEDQLVNSLLSMSKAVETQSHSLKDLVSLHTSF